VSKLTAKQIDVLKAAVNDPEGRLRGHGNVLNALMDKGLAKTANGLTYDDTILITEVGRVVTVSLSIT
jgi:hypothetical protein